MRGGKGMQVNEIGMKDNGVEEADKQGGEPFLHPSLLSCSCFITHTRSL